MATGLSAGLPSCSSEFGPGMPASQAAGERNREFLYPIRIELRIGQNARPADRKVSGLMPEESGQPYGLPRGKGSIAKFWGGV